MERERESSLETYFRVSVRRRGGFAFKLAPTTVGMPDRLVVFPGGAMYLVELKAEDGRLSPVQSVMHGRLAGVGIPVVTLFGREEITRWVADPASRRAKARRSG